MCPAYLFLRCAARRFFVSLPTKCVNRGRQGPSEAHSLEGKERDELLDGSEGNANPAFGVDSVGGRECVSEIGVNPLALYSALCAYELEWRPLLQYPRTPAVSSENQVLKGFCGDPLDNIGTDISFSTISENSIPSLIPSPEGSSGTSAHLHDLYPPPSACMFRKV